MATEQGPWGAFLQYRDLGPIQSTQNHLLNAEAAASGFRWCLLCERTFRSSSSPGPAVCPYPGCEGGVLFELLDWSQVRATNPDYPSVPLEDVVYPLFGAATPDPGPA